MTISLLVAFSGCVCGILLGMPMARAAGGRLQFSGSILEPTCSIASERAVDMVAAASAAHSMPHRLACAETGGSSTTAAPRMYALAVVRLSAAVPDRVLKYFDTYIRESRADAADPVLLVQTYE